MATLLFIDTNIFLDFYRVVGRQGELEILKRIDEHHDIIITGSQVEMEFKKNRARVILESYSTLRDFAGGSTQLPAFLARSKQSAGLATGRKRIEKQVKALRERTRKVFESPARFDGVYQVAQRLFRSARPYNLTREVDARRPIRRRAWRRFMLGYPPRKQGDTSIGDAINWEWIIECAKDSGNDIVLVSRDSDYGIRMDAQLYMNDWLVQEFKDRVGRRRTIRLTERLAEGLSWSEVAVTKSEEKAEEDFLERRRRDFTRGFMQALTFENLLKEGVLANLVLPKFPDLTLPQIPDMRLPEIPNFTMPEFPDIFVPEIPEEGGEGDEANGNR